MAIPTSYPDPPDRPAAPSTWTRLRAAADPFTRRYLDKYTAYPLTREEYVCTFTWPETPLRELHDRFRAAGYTPQRLSAAKRHPESGELHLLSLRRVPDLHPFEPILGTGLADYDGHQCQFHAHVFPSPVHSQFDVFMHYELRPLPLPVEGETLDAAVARAREHYRPVYDREDVNREEWSYLRGVEDPVLDFG